MYLLRFTDGTSTVTLTGDSPILNVTYFPSAAGEDEATVTETALLILEGTEANIRAKLNMLSRLLEDAFDRKELLSDRVFAEKQESSASTIMRSEIVGGEVQWSDVAGRHKLGSATDTVEVAVIFTRLNFWETSTELELIMASSSQSARTGGIDVYNASNADGLYDNSFTLSAPQVVGELPAPIRLRILNNSGSTLATRNFLVSNNVFSGPWSMDYWLLGSEASGGPTASWTGSVSHGTNLFTFELDSGLIGLARGRNFRLIAVFNSVPSGANWQAGIYSSISGIHVALRKTREVYNQLGAQLLDLGTLPIVPGGFEASTGGAALILSARAATSGTVNLAWIQLMSTDSFRRLEQLGYNLSVGAGVEDDGRLGISYGWDGSHKLPIVKAYGNPIHVWPNRQQEITLLVDEGASFVAGRKFLVSAFYRPRYRSV